MSDYGKHCDHAGRMESRVGQHASCRGENQSSLHASESTHAYLCVMELSFRKIVPRRTDGRNDERDERLHSRRGGRRTGERERDTGQVKTRKDSYFCCHESIRLLRHDRLQYLAKRSRHEIWQCSSMKKRFGRIGAIRTMPDQRRNDAR